MKRHLRHKIAYVAIGVVLGIAVSFGVSEADNTAGTTSDPLVTVSYMNQQLEALETKLMAEINAQGSGTTAGTSENVLFEILNVKKGAYIYFGDSAEFILRVGGATALDPNAIGIPDLTSGNKIMNYESIPIDHHILVPTNDGRGIAITQDCWIMIKGNYTLVGN